jgi:hypothetical protein
VDVEALIGRRHPKTRPHRRLGQVARRARRGARDARSRCIQLLVRWEAKYREDPLESIVEVSNRLIRANDDRVRLGRLLGFLHLSVAKHLHQLTCGPDGCRLVTAMNFCPFGVRYALGRVRRFRTSLDSGRYELLPNEYPPCGCRVSRTSRHTTSGRLDPRAGATRGRRLRLGRRRAARPIAARVTASAPP